MQSYIILFGPILVYWFTCILLSPFDLTNEQNKRNRPSKRHVILRVLYLHMLQVLTQLPKTYQDSFLPPEYIRWYRIPLGCFLLITIQYWMHRADHTFPRLYKYHKVHHELVIPYSYGALYNSYGEAILTGGIIGALFLLFGFNSAEFALVITLGNIATVIDHVEGLPLTHHKIHHLDQRGNFSQPLIDIWDRWCGTKLVK